MPRQTGEISRPHRMAFQLPFSFVRLRTKAWLISMNLIILVLVSIYSIWAAYRLFNTTGGYQGHLFIGLFFSCLIALFIGTILLIFVWYLFLQKFSKALIKASEDVIKDPTKIGDQYTNIIFKPMANYLESLHQKWVQSEQEYQAIERYHWMSEISAAVSHEVRNPLTTVRGFLQLFQKKSCLSDEDREIIHLMIYELDSSTALIKDFLDVTRPVTQDFTDINLPDCLTRIIRVLDSLAVCQNVQISLLSPLEQKDLYMKGNQQAFRQVIINLLQNAIQAMPCGGQITISIVPLDSTMQIHIQDNGLGMDEDTLRKIGKPFFTTKPNGTGLGLPMCFRLVEQMNGQLDISSKLGAGTSVTLTFPITPIPSSTYEVKA